MAGRQARARAALVVPLGLCCLLALGGCAFGPRALERTHGLYNEAVKQAYEEQLLLNLVRLRYNDSPNRLNITSIAAQYELSGMAQAVPFFQAAAGAEIGAFSRILPGAQLLGANRPTLSLTPAEDRETVRRFLTPIEPDSLLFFAQIGWPISTVFRLYVDSLNGVPNAPEATGPARHLVPQFEDFQRLAQLIQVAQDRDYVRVKPVKTVTTKGGPVKDGGQTNLVEAAKAGYEYQPGPRLANDPKESTVVLVKTERKLVVTINPKALHTPEVQGLIEGLHLQPGLMRFEITVGSEKDYPGPVLPAETTIHIVPRSTVQALFYLSRGILVPPDHVRSGLAPTTVGPDGVVFDWPEVTRDLFTVHSCKHPCRPQHALVAVRYHGYWFYIDDRDQQSKATFGLMSQLVRFDLSRSRSSDAQARPVLTLPVGR
jgi:hypothetical protein